MSEKREVVDYKPLVRLPQILGAALAANVFIVIAHAAATVSLTDWKKPALLVVLFAWNMKDGFDDFKAYESNYKSGFSLAPTVVYRVLAYVALAASVVSLGEIWKALIWFSIYFGILTVWSANSARRRSQNKLSDENSERLRRRKGWLVIYPICGLAAFCMQFGAEIGFLIGLFVIAALYADDCIGCETYSNKINEVL